MNTVLNYVIELDFLNCQGKFRGNWSTVLEKMTFEVAIFGDFPDIPELKLSLPFWAMEGRMWRC